MELLVVITIIAIMSMATMVMVSDQSEKAKMATAMNDLNAIATAINMAKASGKTVTIADGGVNTGVAVVTEGLSDVESYLGSALADLPAEYVFSGNYIIYADMDEAGAAATYDFGDGRGEVSVQKKFQ